MKKISLLGSLCLVLSLIQLSSCKKEAALPQDGSLSLTTAQQSVTPDLSLCKLRGIIQDYSGIKNAANFTYLPNGNPFKIVYDNNGTGSPDYYFFYDKNQRLVEYRSAHFFGDRQLQVF